MSNPQNTNAEFAAALRRQAKLTREASAEEPPRPKYEYNGGVYTRAGLEQAINQAVATLDPEQWFAGEFEFDEWLSDSIVTGTVTKIAEDL